MKPLDHEETTILLEMLMRLLKTSMSTDIKRSAKSLFTLLTRDRFTTSND